MLAALDFDLFPYLSHGFGGDYVDYENPLWTIKNLTAPGSSRLGPQVARTLRLCDKKVQHLCLALPNSYRGVNVILDRKEESPLTLHSVSRAEVIHNAVQLRERNPLVNVAILDLSLHETSLIFYREGLVPSGEFFCGNSGLGHLLGLFAARLAEQPGRKPSKRQLQMQSRQLLSQLYRPVDERIPKLPLPQDQIDEICAEYARNFCRGIERKFDEFARVERIYLTGGGARILAPWLLREFKHKLVTTTAQEHFVSQAAIIHPFKFLHDFFEKEPEPADDYDEIRNLIPDSDIVFLPRVKTKPFPDKETSPSEPEVISFGDSSIG